MKLRFSNIFIGIFLAFLFAVPFFCLADYQGQRVNFYVDKNFDALGREQLAASLIYITPKIYFYIENDYWNSLDASQQQTALASFNSLALEFNNKIYPTLTSTLGWEWNPGIDNDSHITILFEQLRKDAGGYFSNGNEYYKLQYPLSNEREMVYLNTDKINDSQLKAYLTHEFQHLITFNQKEKTFGVQEEIWLNEMRSEMAVSMLGYNDVYDNSNLQRRVRSFLEKPSDSLTEWQNKIYDYGVLNLFGQYLFDYYGTDIFSHTLKMREAGIESINKFLQGKGYKENFSDVFTNWTIAVLLNNCSYGDKYCYKNSNFSKLQVVPTTNFLPMSGRSSLETYKPIKNWAGDWEKFIGGSGNLKLEFSGDANEIFRVPYIIESSLGKFSVSLLQLDAKESGSIIVPDFGSKNISLTIIPQLQTKVSGFSDSDSGALYHFKVSIVDSSEIPSSQDQQVIDKLLAQIELLKKQIAELQAKLAQQNSGTISCPQFVNNLYYGLTNNADVRCLQQFLISKYPSLYPEKLVTGNYYTATFNAVKRYQAQKGITQTGYFGLLTRSAANNDLTISH